MSEKAYVIGLGNPLRGDDRAGLAAADAFERLLERAPIDGVEVRRSERGGFEILDLVAGARRAVIVDCLEVPAGRPGRVYLLAPDDVRGSARLTGGHDISVGTALELGRMLGAPVPDHIEIVGIEGAVTDELQEKLTPAVAAAAEAVAAWLHHGLGSRQPLSACAQARMADPAGASPLVFPLLERPSG